MYGSITPLLTKFLTPDVVAKMALGAGISEVTSAQTTLSGAVPTILSGLANLASKPEGARQLADAIASQPSNLLDNLAGMIGGSAAGQLTNLGNSALMTLFGASTLGKLASTLGEFGGISEGAARTLLGMVAPVILGVLGRQTGGGTRALTQFFALQKDEFVRAIPSGLFDLLKASGINFKSRASAIPNRLTDTPRTPAEDFGGSAYVMGSSRPSQSSARWAYWVIPLLALAGLLWYLLGGERAREPVAKGPAQAVQPTAQAPVADSDLQRQITAALDTLNSTLQGVKDASSAGQGLARLQQVASELDRLRTAADRLPAETRERIAEAIKVAAARSRTTLDTVAAMPGMSADVGPVIAALRGKVDALARTPGSLAQLRTGPTAEKIIYLARTPSGGVLVSTYFDRGMHNRTGEKLGSISDLIVAPDGTIAAALVGVGGILGIGEKEVAVPFASIEVQRNGNDVRFVIDTTKEALKAAPSYEDTAARVHLTPAPSNNR
jgi:uncharacterized protein DUF937/PRC-barrel domain protein